MSYSDPMRSTHVFSSRSFADALATRSIQAPAGYENARIEDAGVIDVTVAFAADTTAPEIQIGDGTTADRYAAIPIPDGVAIGSASSSRALPDANESSGLGGSETSPANLVVVSDLTDGQLIITYTLAVDAGTAAGTGLPYVTIAWF